MSSLETRKIEPATGTTVTLGEAGDTVTVPTGGIVKTNTVKDSGGNTLWTSDGAGTLSSVNSAIAGSMIFISSQTASDSASLNFTSGIDSTYDEYMFVWVACHPRSNDVSFFFNGSDDASNWVYNVVKTTTFINNYHGEDGSTTLNYSTGSDITQGTEPQRLESGAGSNTLESGSGILHLFNPSSTTYVKHFYSRASYLGEAPGATDGLVAGYFNTTLAITAVTFYMSTGNFDGTIYLYGVN